MGESVGDDFSTGLDLHNSSVGGIVIDTMLLEETLRDPASLEAPDFAVFVPFDREDPSGSKKTSVAWLLADTKCLHFQVLLYLFVHRLEPLFAVQAIEGLFDGVE